MAINTESEDWKDAHHIDYIEIEVENFLRGNPDSAYTVEEIAEYLTQEESQAFPDVLLGENSAARYARIALVASQLEKLNWQSRIGMKNLNGEIYYTYREEGSHFPIADLEDKIPRRIGGVEDDIEDIIERLNNIEYRINQEEIGW